MIQDKGGLIVLNKAIQYILGLVIMIAGLYVFFHWAGYVVANDDWKLFIAGFITFWVIIYLIFGKK